MNTTLTIRIDSQTKKRLDKLAAATARTKSYLVWNAIKDYLETNEWQVQEIKKAVQRADQPGAKFIEHEEVASWIDSWGTKNELKPPKRK